MPSDKKRHTLERERLRLLFRQARLASKMALGAAFLCTLIFYRALDDFTPLAWFAAIAATTLPRFLLFRQFFNTDIRRHPESRWLRWHALTAIPVGLAWGALPLVGTGQEADYIHQLHLLVPGFMLMAAITSYGVLFAQFAVLTLSVGAAVVTSLAITHGSAALPQAVLFSVFLPILLLTAHRYSESIVASLRSQGRAEELVHELTATNNDLLHQNSVLEQQRDLIEQEEALAQHVFRQLTLGGDHKLDGIHAWNQPMGSLSGDLTQTARGPDGQAYVFLGDFTGHGLPAALGALPASSVFLAMAAKGLPVDAIARELNSKLRQLLPIGYFCCAVLLQLSADRRHVQVWNGGLPPVLVRRHGHSGYETIGSHSLPLGVVDSDSFETTAHQVAMRPGDLLYAYTDGLTEAENIDGEMWGRDRLEDFLRRDDLPTPKLPSLIDAVLEHVNLAPASDDISIVEVEASPKAERQADAA